MEEQKFTEAKQKIEAADCIAIGIGNDLLLSEGIDIHKDNDDYESYFRDFRQQHNYRNILHQCLKPLKEERQRWAYAARMYTFFLKEKKTSPALELLLKLVGGKEYFILTTNIDGRLVPTGFKEDRVFEMEGSVREIQCRNGCNFTVWSADDILPALDEACENCSVPEEMLPKCPVCGGEASMHIQVDRSFIQDRKWQKRYDDYRGFISNARGKNMIFLEVGVEAGNQMIKGNFLQFLSSQKTSSRIIINDDIPPIPYNVREKTLCLCGRPADMLEKILEA